MFKDRADAGRRLAERLAAYEADDAVVLALPRGGVVTGHAIARRLGLPLDIVITRKIGHPHNPEYALCAVDEEGLRLCNEAELQSIDPAWLLKETQRQQQEAQRRSKAYRKGRKPPSLEGKTVLIVDDGAATGLTLRLAIAVVRAQHPKRVVVAVPVAPTDVVQKLRREADDTVVLEPPEDFSGAVGAHYERFPQVEDDEVVALLADDRSRA